MLPRTYARAKGSQKISFLRLPVIFFGTEMKFIAVEKEVPIVFRHVMFCVTIFRRIHQMFYTNNRSRQKHSNFGQETYGFFRDPYTFAKYVIVVMTTYDYQFSTFQSE